MSRKQVIARRLESIKSRLPDHVQLLAVSKYTDIDDIEQARQSGQWDFGENRIDELTAKAQQSHHNLRWHFIGKIQKNKINRLLGTPGLTFLHSVDSQKILEELYKREEHLASPKLSFFLQVNTSGEEQKQGFVNRDELYDAIRLCLERKKSPLQFVGLMTMGSLEKDARPCFRQLAELRKKIETDFSLKGLQLSMGMGGDFPIAVEEGADWVRIGRLIFSRGEP